MVRISGWSRSRSLTWGDRQFTVALVVYSVLSYIFPPKETFIPEAITTEDSDDAQASDKSSHLEKGADADVKDV